MLIITYVDNIGQLFLLPFLSFVFNYIYICIHLTVIYKCIISYRIIDIILFFGVYCINHITDIIVDT